MTDILGRQRRDERRSAGTWIINKRISRYLNWMVTLFFIVILVDTVPGMAWGTSPHSGDCNFEDSSTWNAPHQNCDFSAQLDPNVTVGYESEESQPGLYYNEAHTYLIENAIRIFREKGYNNWAYYLSNKDHFQAIADGVTFADKYKGETNIELRVSLFWGTITLWKHDWYLTVYAGFDHYYHQVPGHPEGTGLFMESIDLGADFLHYFSIALAGAIVELAKWCISTTTGGLYLPPGILKIEVSVIPDLEIAYPSAAVAARDHFGKALDYAFSGPIDPETGASKPDWLYWPERSPEYNSLFQLGWSLHFMQDIGVSYHLHDVHHSLESWKYPHNDFEDQANGKGDINSYGDYHVRGVDWNVGTKYADNTIEQLAQEEALAILDNEQDWDRALSKDEKTREPAVQYGVKISEQFTAAVLAKYLDARGLTKKLEPLSGRVLDLSHFDKFGHAPVPGAFVFYRNKLFCKQSIDLATNCIIYEGAWNYIRTDRNGEFVLNLPNRSYHPYDTYQIRPNMPGYRYKGVQYGTGEIMNAVLDDQTFEYTPQREGEGTSQNYTFLLSPQPGGWGSRVESVQLPPQGSLGANPKFAQSAQWLLNDGTSGALSPDLKYIVSPAKRTAIQKAIMDVQVGPMVLVVPLQDAQDIQRIPLPQESSVEISLSHLIDLNNGQTLTSSSAIVSTIENAINQQALRNTALSGNTLSNTIQSADTLSKQGIPIDTSPSSQEITINEPVFPSENWQKVLGTLPKIDAMDANGNRGTVPDLSYALGNEPFSSGGSLYRNDMVRAPSPGAEIEVTLASGPGFIGPDFRAKYPYYSMEGMVGMVTNLGVQAYNVVLNTASTIMSHVTSLGTPQNISAGNMGERVGTNNLQDISPTVQSIILTTDSEGKAAFKLKTGNQAGIIRVFLTVKNDPAAPDIKGMESLEFLVQPPIYEKDTDQIIPPTITVVQPPQRVPTGGSSYGKARSGKTSGFCINLTAGGEVSVVPCPTGESPQGIQKGTPCDDGNTCTVNDYYVSGDCVGGQALTCDDGNPDTADTCDPNSGCVYTPTHKGWADGTPCNDGNRCTVNDNYKNGVCIGGPALPCNDGNPDTVDTCDRISGCVFTLPGRGPADGTPCEDGNLCTINDYYKNGVCIGGQINSCDDGNPATVDTCDQIRGACVHTATGRGPIDGTPCEDGNLCTINDHYENRICVGGKVMSCDDGNPETVDTCDQNRGACIHTATRRGPFDGTPCDDGDQCTVNDYYEDGVCRGGQVLSCDDGKPSTADTCDPDSGCVFTPLRWMWPDGTPCNDGDQCTVNDYYEDGVCRGGQVLSCNDGNPDTADSCDPNSGCVFTLLRRGPPDGTPCEDGNLCTVNDFYESGVCFGGQVRSCDDGNPATTDTCDQNSGSCVHVAPQEEQTCPRRFTCMYESEAKAHFEIYVRYSDTPCYIDYPADTTRGKFYKYCYRQGP